MSTSDEMMRRLMGGSPEPKEHSKFCHCGICMESGKIQIKTLEGHAQGLGATMVNRRNPDNPVRPLMKAAEAHAILKAGSIINMGDVIGFRKADLPEASLPGMAELQERTISATWKHRSEEAAASGEDASVFGGLGVLLVPANFRALDIPKMNARDVSVILPKNN